MRMTNKIMRNNSAYNINQNKILQDKLTNQMTTQSKIVRPSDDPVVAIRALRLRSNVTTVTQYNDRNAKDADQWLALTADAMDTVDQVLTDLYRQATTSADKYETSDDLRILMSQMKQLTAEFYSCANVDYAGRYVFSGYRTDLPVTFTEEDMKAMKEHPVSYNIDEKFGFQDIKRINYTDYDKLSENLNGNLAGTGPATAPGITDENSYQQNVVNTTMYSFRISYNNLDSLGTEMTDENGNTVSAGRELTFTMPDGTKVTAKAQTDANGVVQKGADGNPIVDVTAVDAAGNPVVPAPQVMEFADQEAAYKAIASGNCTGIAYIPTSGEMVFARDFYEKNFSEAAFNASATGFQVNYDKSDWKNGDINPVHYFKCIETKNMAAPGETPDLRKTAYNTQRDEGRNQDIYYDVGYNQQIQVNTRADEIFTHNVQRDMDDFEHYLKQLEDIETLEADLTKKRKDYAEDSAEYKDLTLRLEGVEKAKTYIRENVHTKFENQITKYQQYMDDSRVAMTDCATRRSRLDLISTRLTNQKMTFKELQQDNEGIDITEVAVELTASELTYSAALMATGKIMQTNLMNYI
ncbi:MAG: hypothetical protein K2I53_14855 [Lachnospiraceae bacterium]|nr:hypothetical protein [Lachnospiraceae bacterium]